MDTTLSRQPGNMQPYARSWAFSILLHALAVGSAVVFLGDLKLIPEPEPFKWDVALVETPQPKPVEQPKAPAAKPARTKPVQAEPTPAKLQPVERQTIVRTVQTVQTVRQVVREASQEIRESKPVVQESLTAATAVHRDVQAVEASQQTAVETVSTVSMAQTGTVGSYFTGGQRPLRPHVIEAGGSNEVWYGGKATIRRELTEAGPAVVEMAPAETPAPIEGRTVVKKEDAQVVAKMATDAPVPVQEHTIVKTEAALKSVAPPIQEASVRNLPAQPAPPTKADYGWLAQSLWDRVARLKHYPHLARTRHLEGRVVVRAVIRENGHLHTVEVAESSGHAILDEDALEIIKRACPLKLKYALGRSEVVVQIPINYRLEH